MSGPFGLEEDWDPLQDGPPEDGCPEAEWAPVDALMQQSQMSVDLNEIAEIGTIDLTESAPATIIPPPASPEIPNEAAKRRPVVKPTAKKGKPAVKAEKKPAKKPPTKKAKERNSTETTRKRKQPDSDKPKPKAARRKVSLDEIASSSSSPPPAAPSGLPGLDLIPLPHPSVALPAGRAQATLDDDSTPGLWSTATSLREKIKPGCKVIYPISDKPSLVRTGRYIADIHDPNQPVRCIAIPSPLAGKLFPHQIGGIQFAWRALFRLRGAEGDEVPPHTFPTTLCHADLDGAQSGAVLAHHQGTGKTLLAITILTVYHLARRQMFAETDDAPLCRNSASLGHTIIVAPGAVHPTWRAEWRKHLDNTGLPLKGVLREYEQFSKWKNEGGVLIVTPQRLVRVARGWKTKEGVRDEEEDDDDEDGDPDDEIINFSSNDLQLDHDIMQLPSLAFMDEAQYVTSRTGNVFYKGIEGLRTKGRVALTGTGVMENRLQDIYNIIQLVCPNYLTASQFEVFRRNILGNEVHCPIADKECLKQSFLLQSILKPCLSRRLCKQLRSAIPPIKDVIVTIPLTTEQVVLYKLFNREVTKPARHSLMRSSGVFRILAVLSHIVNVMRTEETQQDTTKPNTTNIEGRPDHSKTLQLDLSTPYAWLKQLSFEELKEGATQRDIPLSIVGGQGEKRKPKGYEQLLAEVTSADKQGPYLADVLRKKWIERHEQTQRNADTDQCIMDAMMDTDQLHDVSYGHRRRHDVRNELLDDDEALEGDQAMDLDATLAELCHDFDQQEREANETTPTDTDPAAPKPKSDTRTVTAGGIPVSSVQVKLIQALMYTVKGMMEALDKFDSAGAKWTEETLYKEFLTNPIRVKKACRKAKIAREKEEAKLLDVRRSKAVPMEAPMELDLPETADEQTSEESDDDSGSEAEGGGVSQAVYEIGSRVTEILHEASQHQSCLPITSPKHLAVIHLLQALYDPHTQRFTERALVFAASRPMLHRVRQAVDSYFADSPINIKTGLVDGHVPIPMRPGIVSKLESESLDVLFATVRTTGVGWNLQSASVVIVLDAQWNPAVTAQAVCRAHRVGQRRRVRVYRLVGRGTFEEEITKKSLEKDFLKRRVVDGLSEKSVFDALECQRSMSEYIDTTSLNFPANASEMSRRDRLCRDDPLLEGLRKKELLVSAMEYDAFFATSPAISRSEKKDTLRKADPRLGAAYGLPRMLPYSDTNPETSAANTFLLEGEEEEAEEERRFSRKNLAREADTLDLAGPYTQPMEVVATVHGEVEEEQEGGTEDPTAPTALSQAAVDEPTNLAPRGVHITMPRTTLNLIHREVTWKLTALRAERELAEAANMRHKMKEEHIKNIAPEGDQNLKRQDIKRRPKTVPRRFSTR